MDGVAATAVGVVLIGVVAVASWRIARPRKHLPILDVEALWEAKHGDPRTTDVMKNGPSHSGGNTL
jgi:hypothetical protein